MCQISPAFLSHRLRLIPRSRGSADLRLRVSFGHLSALFNFTPPEPSGPSYEYARRSKRLSARLGLTWLGALRRHFYRLRASPAPPKGGEEDEIEAMEGTYWQLVQSKPARKKQSAERGKCQTNASRSFQDSGGVGAKSSRRAAALKKRVIAASRTPELPSTHCKIIVRPRGGLDLLKTSCYGISTAIFIAAGITATQATTDLVCTNVVQNIAVVCTAKEDNARKILALKNIRVNGKEHEVAVYAAAEGNYVKGVVRNVKRDIGDAELARLIVHRGNPSLRGVKRIKETGSVVVFSDG
ncbi:hypothetical protein HPB49_001134 [Dermacentor silvarum]|uniref:Uncharacterized protein n=1 Tax=Dermacentor silvarum TaxID=543639 RepID=A0ACB8CUU7_DERSI|nr:hypothetical protein HPB49_001134 [Dermacentor silvarum]